MQKKCLICENNENLENEEKFDFISNICDKCKSVLFENLSNEAIEQLKVGFDLLNNYNFFDAEDFFRSFIFKNPEIAVAYWGLILSKNGVVYSNKGKNLIPNIKLLKLNSILQDSDYEQLIKFSTDSQKEILTVQAQTLEQIRCAMIESVDYEDDYHIMICHNLNTENKKILETTEHLYKQLSKKGFKVYYEPKTLSNNFKDNTEPFVFNAINSTFSMIVLTEDNEDLKESSLKNQIIRYNKEIDKNHKSKDSIIFINDEKISNSEGENDKFVFDDEELITKVINKIEKIKNQTNELLQNEIVIRDNLDDQFEKKDVVLMQKIFKYLKYFSIGLFAIWFVMYFIFAIPYRFEILLLASLGILFIIMLGIKIYIFYKKKFNHLGYIFLQLIIICLLAFFSIFNTYLLTSNTNSYEGTYRSRRYVYYVNDAGAKLIGYDNRLNMIPLIIGSNSKIGGVDLIEVGANAFGNYNFIYNFKIPTSLTTIRYGAFRMCKTISKITIPENVKYIGEKAFFGWTRMQKIFFENNLYFDSLAEVDESLCTRKLPSNFQSDSKWNYGCDAYIYVRNVIYVNNKEFKVINLRSPKCNYYYNNRYNDFVDFVE